MRDLALRGPVPVAHTPDAARSFRERLGSDARDAWRLSPRLAEGLFALPFVGAALVGLAALHPPLFRILVREDSVLEWAEVAGYAAAAVLAVAVGRRLAGSGERGASLAFLLFALGCTLVAGEEISWGQRLFALETPQTLEAVNVQGELTAHNVSGADSGFRVLLLAVALYGMTAPWLRPRARREGVPAFYVPPLFLTSFFLVLFAYTFVRLLFLPTPSYAAAKFSELPELCLASALFLFALLTWRRLCHST